VRWCDADRLRHHASDGGGGIRQRLLADSMKRLETVDNCIRNQMAVEGGQLPAMGAVVLDVRRIDEGDQHVHIERKANQGNSSRS